MNNAQHTADSAKDKAKQVVDSARDGVEVAKHSTLQAFASGAAMLAKGVSAATVLVATLRKLDRDDGLAWFGLARRRSPFFTIAIFGAGTAMGATMALLLAPTSGEELRRQLLERLMSTRTKKTASGDAADPEAEATGAEPRSSDAAVPPNGESAKP